MRCREAKLQLTAQRDGDPTLSDTAKLQEHLKQCPACRADQQRQQRLNALLLSATPRSYASISTERIMLAVQRQKRITQQLENIRTQQQFRLAHLRRIGIPLAAITFFTLGSIPLLLLALTIVQPDLFDNILSVLSDVVDVLVVITGYLQTILTLITRDNRLLSGVALVLVVMMGMWLRLMRYPQEI
jgi:predicted anti-sigma-YlaC factor YlaD